MATRVGIVTWFAAPKAMIHRNLRKKVKMFGILVSLNLISLRIKSLKLLASEIRIQEAKSTINREMGPTRSKTKTMVT